MKPLALLLCLSPFLFSQPRITNAKLEPKPVTGNVKTSFDAIVSGTQQAAWIGYAVPVIPGEHNSCCFYSDSSRGVNYRGCMLEGHQWTGTPPPQQTPGAIKLEGSRELNVLFRVEGRQVTKIRTFSGDCELDAGGLVFHWLTGVKSAESLELLDSFVAADSTADRDRFADHAVSAISLHSDPGADTYLERYINPARPERLRRKTAFWLGAARGRKGYELLTRVLRDDPSDKVKESALHALTVTKEPGAMKLLVDTARNDKSAHVRGQALFWLAQQKSNEAASTIRGAIDNDPEMRVKEKAVFAISQLPKEQSIPMLIDLAKNNKSVEVRKKAMFWLGQSKDLRAVAFFEELIGR